MICQAKNWRLRGFLHVNIYLARIGRNSSQIPLKTHSHRLNLHPENTEWSLLKYFKQYPTIKANQYLVAVLV